MGLLQNSALSDFRKITLSIWFRIPQASIDSAVAVYNAESGNYPPPPLLGVIPIVVFGGRGTVSGTPAIDGTTIPHFYYVHIMNWFGDPVNDYIEHAEAPGSSGWQPLFTQAAGTPDSYSSSPSYIGVDISDPTNPLLCYNFETAVAASKSGFNFITTGGSADDSWQYYMASDGSSAVPPDGHTYISPRSINYTSEDITDSASTGVYKDVCPGAAVSPDHWHHIIVSADFTAACTTSGLSGNLNNDNNTTTPPRRTNAGDGVASAPKLWIAFDNRNLTGSNLSQNWPVGADPNAIIAPDAYGAATIFQPSTQTSSEVYQPFSPWWRKLPGQHVTASGVAAPSYSIDASINASGGALGVPAPSDYASRVQTIEMAEMQIFLDSAIDTSDPAMRALFITGGKPASTTAAADFFGKTPEVLLTGDKKWIAGTNLGSLGDFTRVGSIITYSGSPAL